MKAEFKVKLTPKDDKALYSQRLPTPIHLEDLIVELALMYKNGIITELPFSKYASPIFAQRKPNGKLRHLVDLSKINSLIADDYTNNNHPVCTSSDSSQHLAGKSLLQTRALSGLSLFADGGPAVSGKACTQFLWQNFFVLKTCTASQQICTCLVKFHARVLGPSCQS